MILLDTNVLSELARADLNGSVWQWIARQPASEIWTTSITVFELYRGVRLMPVGRRRKQVEFGVETVLAAAISDRIASFDENAAKRAAEVAASRQAMGRNTELGDYQIAGIALSRQAALATRNLRHFAELGILLIDPWAA